MALFSVIGRRDIPIRGDGVYLRLSEMRDFQQWAALRETSRAFLTPWEPLWPSDDLTRASFRYRVRRHAEEMARDESFSFFIFREQDDFWLAACHLATSVEASPRLRPSDIGWANPMRGRVT